VAMTVERRIKAREVEKAYPGRKRFVGPILMLLVWPGERAGDEKCLASY